MCYGAVFTYSVRMVGDPIERAVGASQTAGLGQLSGLRFTRPSGAIAGETGGQAEFRVVINTTKLRYRQLFRK